MFYFHSLDGSTVGTRKRLCVFGGRGLCVFGGLCVDMWLFLTVGTLLLHCWYSLVTIGTPMVIFAVLTVLWRLVHCWYSLGRPVTIGTPMVLSVFDDWYSVPFVKNSQKTVKTAKMTIGVPIVTWLHRVRRIHKAVSLRYLARPPSHVRGSGHSPSPMGRADSVSTWTSMRLATACCYTLFYLLMMPAARLVCQRPSSNFPYFRTPLANFLLSCPNSVEYGNCKTTTLLPSAKCTRPLFQGRTGCGGRPSGWHDIVSCQRLVSPYFRHNWHRCRQQ